MELAERETRAERASALIPELERRGVVLVAVTFVDTSGLARVKAVPLRRLPQLAAWGVGTSPSFDHFRSDDWLVTPQTDGARPGEAPVGDLRVLPDLDRVVPLSAQPGWAWTPGTRYGQDGLPHPLCGRALLGRIAGRAHDARFEVRSAFELEWVVSVGDGDELVPAGPGPAYGLARLATTGDYARDVVAALLADGVEVDQFHPEYAAGQFEVSVTAETPLAAADTSVLVRSTIRAVGAAHGLRTSFAPKVHADGVGNGGHVHLSLWRDGANLMRPGPDGRPTGAAEGFAAGILARLPALLALGAPSVASYLRLVPSHWAGAYACWGPENREAALRTVTGTRGSEAWAANLEVKCVDLTANPYLLLAGLVAAGLAGVDDGARLPEPIDVDPAALDEAELDRRGIRRLPQSLAEATDAFAADRLLRAQLGGPLADAVLAVRRSEVERFTGVGPEEIVTATRWVH